MSSTAPAPRYYPKEIGNILYDPGKNLVGFHVIIDGNLVSHAQVHAKIVEKMSKYAGTIRFIKIYSYLHCNDIALVFFFDITGKKVDPHAILADLQSVPVFKSVQLIKPIKEGLIFDTYSFPPLYAGEKAIIFHKAMYEAIIKDLREKYGPAFNAILYHIGFQVGHRSYIAHVEKYGEDPETLFTIALENAKQLGHGIFQLIKYGPKEAIVRVYENFECQLFEKAEKPQSHLVRGMIAGFLAAMWNLEMGDVNAVETACMATGSPYCQFHITRKTRKML